MARIFYVHWNEAELEARAKPLRARGHDVRGQWSAEAFEKWGDYVPDVCVLSLDRLPSHSRHVLRWIWEAKKRRTIPVIFAGGAPDKVAAARKEWPDAAFGTSAEVAGLVARVLQGKVKATPSK